MRAVSAGADVGAGAGPRGDHPAAEEAGVTKLIALKEWAKRRMENPPTERTLRRWATAGNILPRPTKYGRTYMVAPDARYIDCTDPNYIEEVAAALREQTPQ